MATANRPQVLCLDDEPQVLEGLALHLRRHYELDTATSGAAALELLERKPTLTVVLSDMRMPGMDGAAFLARARELAPDAVRMLLTGQADLASAIAAVNEGQIFRFLTKPCPPPVLLAAVAAAVAQHRLVTAERVLLEQTLHGAVKTLTDVLALVSPTAFGRATRIKQLVSEIAERVALPGRWQVEVAAMLSQLGQITLPPETAEKAYYNRPLSKEERRLVERLPEQTEALLGNIPRLEGVREILRSHPRPYRPDLPAPADSQDQAIRRGAQILRLAVDFDALESSMDAARGSPGRVLEALRGRADQYDPELLQALAALRAPEEEPEVRELPVDELRVGMVLAEDVEMQNGSLLVARGYEVTERFLERVQNFPGAMKKKAWRVIVRSDGAGQKL